MASHFYFTIKADEVSGIERLAWGDITTGADSGNPLEITKEQAQIVAISNIANALDNVALQLHQALGPLQEIADNLRRKDD